MQYSLTDTRKVDDSVKNNTAEEKVSLKCKHKCCFFFSLSPLALDHNASLLLFINCCRDEDDSTTRSHELFLGQRPPHLIMYAAQKGKKALSQENIGAFAVFALKQVCTVDNVNKLWNWFLNYFDTSGFGQLRPTSLRI